MQKFARLAAVAALALSGLIAVVAVPLQAGASPATQPILDITTPAAGGSFQATNTSTLTPTFIKLQSPTSLNILGILHIFGVTADGSLMDLAANSAQAWHSSNITNEIHGAPLSGAVTATSLIPGQVSIFAVGSGLALGHLIQYSTSPLTGNLWVATDLSLSAESNLLLNPSPSIAVDATGLFHVYATSDHGHLIEFSASARGGWTAIDVTSSNSLKKFSGTASVTMCPSGAITATCAFGRNALGNLVEYVRAATGVWRSRDLGAMLGVTGLSGDPTALQVGGLVIAAVTRTDGRLQIAVSTDAAFRSGTFRAAPIFDVPGGGDVNPPALLQVPAGLLVSMRSQGGHLVNQTLFGLSGLTAGSSTDVTAALGGGTTIASRISSISLNGTVHLAAGSSITASPRHDVLATSKSLLRGQQLTSPNGIFQARLQTDGNFGLFAFANALIWTPMLVNPGADRVTITAEGNLSFQTNSGQSLLAYGYKTGRGTSLVLYNNGLLALVSPSGDVLWSVGGDLGNRIIQRARTQIGIGETPDGSNCNPYTAFFPGRGYDANCAPGTRAESWCSDFANWVWLSEGAATDGLSGWSYYFVDYGSRHGTLKVGSLNNPQIGDAVVWGSMADKYGQHIGLITDVRYGYIRVLSGNSGSDNVSESDWIDAASSTISGYGIVGYITPVPGNNNATTRQASPFQRRGITQAMIDSQDTRH